MLLNIQLYCLDKYVFILSFLIPAQPHLYGVSGGLWQLSVEPGRVVDVAAGVAPTIHPVPQRVARMKDSPKWPHITEIAVVDVRGYQCNAH